jgi:PTH1 family peptidyl-tRNA hydrolase
MKLIVGLGNPGKEYGRTKHNAGFLAVDALADAAGAVWSDDAKRKTVLAKTTIDGQTVLLAKPQTFMNLSGEAVQAVSSYYKVAPKDILVVQDELDLAPGSMAFLAKGGDAGHNGIASIQEKMGMTDIARLRIGIGRPAPPQAKEDWVLGPIEEETLKTIEKTSDAIKDWIQDGLTKAMNKWN